MRINVDVHTEVRVRLHQIGEFAMKTHVVY
jgi:hypothetical protein